MEEIVIKVLVSDPLSEEGVRKLETEMEVDVITNLSPQDLIDRIRDYDALAIRSGTKVTAEVIDAADKLKVIGRAGVGVDNIDVEAATRKGIIVVNTPGGNTISAAEHTIAMMLSLARNIPQANNSLKAGEWNRKRYTGVEVYNKTLGIVGLGRIGAEIASRMKSFGMRILAYDPFVTEEKAASLGIRLASLQEIYRESDFITVHTPLTKETRNLIDEEQMKMMKPGVRLINCARGGIINEEALAKAVAEGRVGGAAVDVFTKEPPIDNPLLEEAGVIVTPHLGASTAEAQVNVAVAVAEQILAVARGEMPPNALNMPAISAETMAMMGPYMDLVEKMARLAAQLGEDGYEKLEIVYGGTVAEKETKPVTISAVKGFLETIGHSANFVNSLAKLRDCGIALTESRTESTNGYSNIVTLTLSGPKGSVSVYGTVYGKNEGRIVQINEYRVYVPTEGCMIIATHEDRPNIIGPCCVVLGEDDINIGGMHVGRKASGGEQIMVLNVDHAVSDDTLKRLAGVPGVSRAKMITL
ncbi:phosphoglycerate dehydrogenase [Candidatus Methanocrinis natronophilus]|uniref:D-3-phosphoglycerate dehydrogenase n=1 Tax=Candidatus Methanocrinis natronophilus TaxID=3033396 RepID=A0ABT5X4Z4_9EURY|nr:phosphoglycerate dehydrogenase [Candidatus Methanocrinis natronophilus]MDF0589723.1 phosphoglycerate dehydrogenase [Candidatus Methanocrinis natronophilus]